jgi:cation transport ATPase
MQNLCRHCATAYIQDSGVGEFCCSGCQQIYLLIKDGGMGDFYRLQDRASPPVKDRRLYDIDIDALCEAQRRVELGGGESVEAVFEIQGMSCVACAWLSERLAKNQTGLFEARASLSRHSLTLHWKRGAFDLSKLGLELLKFGYHLRSTPKDPGSEPRISPLFLRLLLTLIFTSNALLLAVFSEYVIRKDEFLILLHLLSMACLCFTLLLGATPFFLSAYRAAKIRRLHSDWLPVAMIIASFGYFGFVTSVGFSVAVFLLSGLVCVLITARWLGALLAKC